jgi:hypothetical protein
VLSSINANFVTHNEETNPHHFVPVLNVELSRSLLKEKKHHEEKKLRKCGYLKNNA